MKAHVVVALSLASSLVLSGAIPGWAADDAGPTGRMGLTLRGGSRTDPAQAEAARAAARQAGTDAAAAEAKRQEERQGKQARRLSQEALQRHDAPLRDFGVLTGPLSPTVPPTRAR